MNPHFLQFCKKWCHMGCRPEKKKNPQRVYTELYDICLSWIPPGTYFRSLQNLCASTLLSFVLNSTERFVVLDHAHRSLVQVQPLDEEGSSGSPCEHCFNLTLLENHQGRMMERLFKAPSQWVPQYFCTNTNRSNVVACFLLPKQLWLWGHGQRLSMGCCVWDMRFVSANKPEFVKQHDECQRTCHKYEALFNDVLKASLRRQVGHAQVVGSFPQPYQPRWKWGRSDLWGLGWGRHTHTVHQLMLCWI